MRQIARLPSHQTPAPLLCWLHADRFTSLVSNTRRPCRFRAPPLAASPQKVPPDMVGAEVVRFVPLKRCTLWRWGCAPKNTRAEANPSTKTELSHKMNEAWKSSPAWGAWEILRPGGFPIGEHYRPKLTARFGGFSVGQLGFCARIRLFACTFWNSSVFVPPRHHLPKHRRQRRRRRIAHLEDSRA